MEGPRETCVEGVVMLVPGPVGIVMEGVVITGSGTSLSRAYRALNNTPGNRAARASFLCAVAETTDWADALMPAFWVIASSRARATVRLSPFPAVPG